MEKLAGRVMDRLSGLCPWKLAPSAGSPRKVWAAKGGLCGGRAFSRCCLFLDHEGPVLPKAVLCV